MSGGLPRDTWRGHHGPGVQTSGVGVGTRESPSTLGARRRMDLPSPFDRNSLDDSASSYSGGSSSIYTDEDDSLPYPGFLAVTFGCLTQEAAPRAQCLALITNPYPLLLLIA